jgi:hypothetical protein
MDDIQLLSIFYLYNFIRLTTHIITKNGPRNTVVHYHFSTIIDIYCNLPNL